MAASEAVRGYAVLLVIALLSYRLKAGSPLCASQAVMLGMTGLRLGALGSDPTSWAAPGRTAALPAGWDSVSFAAWLGGKRHRVVARHGAAVEITPLE